MVSLVCASSHAVLAHDAGHTGVTGDWWWDRVIGMIVADWIGGLSLGWWCDVSSASDSWTPADDRTTIFTIVSLRHHTTPCKD